MRAPTTVPDLLVSRLRGDASRPFVTAYDDATGERTELSVTTFANWVSKSANLLTDELGLDEGDTVLVDLPPHWLVPVFAIAAWSAGLAVTTDATVEHRLAVVGPDGLDRAAEEVLACSLHPFATRFADPLPPGVHDHGSLWPGQSDVFVPVVPPVAGTAAWRAPDGSRTHGDLLAAATATSYDEGVRVLTDRHPLDDGGVATLLAPLLHDGSVVLVRHPVEAQWPARREDERATAELRGQPANR